jgi:hypothetical protein
MRSQTFTVRLRPRNQKRCLAREKNGSAILRIMVPTRANLPFFRSPWPGPTRLLITANRSLTEASKEGQRAFHASISILCWYTCAFASLLWVQGICYSTTSCFRHSAARSHGNNSCKPHYEPASSMEPLCFCSPFTGLHGSTLHVMSSHIVI